MSRKETMDRKIGIFPIASDPQTHKHDGAELENQVKKLTSVTPIVIRKDH